MDSSEAQSEEELRMHLEHAVNRPSSMGLRQFEALGVDGSGETMALFRRPGHEKADVESDGNARMRPPGGSAMDRMHFDLVALPGFHPIPECPFERSDQGLQGAKC